jgi:VanZ family protein
MAASVGAIYWLSSMPDRSGAEGQPFVRLASNLSHAPVYAGLAFLSLKTLSTHRDVSLTTVGLAFAGALTCAVLDEWHQSFVFGRDASVGDLLVDLAGISVMLSFLYGRARVRPQRT